MRGETAELSAFGFLSSLHTMSFTFSCKAMMYLVMKDANTIAQLLCHVSSCGPRWKYTPSKILACISSRRLGSGSAAFGNMCQEMALRGQGESDPIKIVV